jgi:hypothetical protein
MALSTPDHVQLFGTDDEPVGSGGFKLTGEAKEGDGFCRVWLRPIEAWDRYDNPRMDSDDWDARAYRKLDSAFEFVPEFTLDDLETMAENFEFPDASDIFQQIEFNGDPVHDRVLAWARKVTGATTEEGEVADYEVREPIARQKRSPGSRTFDFDDDLVRSDSTPAPLGGVKDKRPAAIPESAKKAGLDAPAVKPAAKAADESVDVADDASTSNERAAKKEAVAPEPPESADKNPAGDTNSESSSASEDSGASADKAEASKKASGSAKKTQAMSMMSDDDEDDSLDALRARLAKSRSKKNDG